MKGYRKTQEPGLTYIIPKSLIHWEVAHKVTEGLNYHQSLIKESVMKGAILVTNLINLKALKIFFI